MDASTGDDFPAQGHSDERFQIPHPFTQRIFGDDSDFTSNVIFVEYLPEPD